jgi:hypothetical protein
MVWCGVGALKDSGPYRVAWLAQTFFFWLVVSNVLGNNDGVLSRSYDDGWGDCSKSRESDNTCMRFVLELGSARAASRLDESTGGFHRK